jgi:hypothetical protein
MKIAARESNTSLGHRVEVETDRLTNKGLGKMFPFSETRLTLHLMQRVINHST